MTPEERAELRAKAEAAGGVEARWYAWETTHGAEWHVSLEGRPADPPTVLALLDDLEAAEGRLARGRRLVARAEEQLLRSRARVFIDPYDLRAALGADDAEVTG